MKKESFILIACFIFMVIGSIILLAVQSMLPASKVDEMFGQKVNIVNTQPVIDEDYTNILEVGEVVNLGGEKLADIYVVRTRTSYFYMELYVAIDAAGKVYAIDKEVVTYDDTSASYFNQVRAYLLKNYNGLYYENVQFIDGAAGASTIGVSRSTIKLAVSQVIIYHVGEPIDYIALLFNVDGDAYQQGTPVVNGDMIRSNVVVNAQTFTVYQIEGEGTYYDHQNTHTGSITILVAVDGSGVIKYVSLPIDLYGHTSSTNFYGSAQTFLNGFVNYDLSLPIADTNAGVTENAQGSRYLINTLLQAVQEDYNG